MSGLFFDIAWRLAALANPLTAIIIPLTAIIMEYDATDFVQTPSIQFFQNAAECVLNPASVRKFAKAAWWGRLSIEKSIHW